MNDLIPELLTLKSILIQHKSIHESMFRLKHNERVSAPRLERVKTRIHYVLKHKESLSFECQNLFSQYKSDEDEFLLLLLTLSLLRNEHAEKEKCEEAYLETFQAMRMSGDGKENFEVIYQASLKPFVIPDDVKKSPSLYNSLLLEMPDFFLSELYHDYSPTESLSIVKSIRKRPLHYYKSIDDKNPTKDGYKEIDLDDGTKLFETKTSYSTKDMKEMNLYPVRYVENIALSKIGFSSLSTKILLLGLKEVNSYLPFAYRLKDCYEKQLVEVEEDSVRYRYAVNLSIQHHFDYVKPLCSSFTLIKTYLPYESFDVVVYSASDSNVGYARKKIEILPSLEKKTFLTNINKEKEELKESSMFVNKGGVLLFIASSFLKKETKEVINDFLMKNKEFTLEDESVILADRSDSDLGYYAILRRKKK